MSFTSEKRGGWRPLRSRLVVAVYDRQFNTTLPLSPPIIV